MTIAFRIAIITLVFVTHPAFAQEIALSNISEYDCTASYNQAIFSTSKSLTPPCLLFFTDESGSDAEAVIKMNGQLIKLFRKPKIGDVYYSHFVLKSEDQSISVVLETWVIDSCSGQEQCDGGTSRGTLTVRSGKAKRTYRIEFYRGG